ncbi:MAG: hypothetical protein IBX44_05160 [Sulfurospirillum sp.]|nr:hypothetical protein [Sulfurospirillum sp.]
MKLSQGRSLFSLNYLFASFFGAALVAGAFAYSNYRFSEYKFIDFNAVIFYTKKDIFIPKSDSYTVVIYSSNMQDFETLKKNIATQDKLLVLDMFQQKRGLEDDILYLGAGMNTLLQVIQRFNIEEIPAKFRIIRYQKNIYKQDSSVQIIQ